MRDRIQLELSVGEYQAARRAERQRLASQLRKDLERAERDRPAWYQWVLDRHYRVHDHSAMRENGEPAACPVPGCSRTKGRMLRDDEALPF